MDAECGTAESANQNKYYYIGLWIGSNGAGNGMTKMRFLIDTGSAWLWMPGQKCTTC